MENDALIYPWCIFQTTVKFFLQDGWKCFDLSIINYRGRIRRWIQQKRPDPDPPLVVKLAPQGAESYGGAESLGWSRNRTKPNLLSAAGAPKEPNFMARAGAAKASGKIQNFWLGARRTRNFWLTPNRIEIWHRLQVWHGNFIPLSHHGSNTQLKYTIHWTFSKKKVLVMVIFQ
jgi:hypothetical protein